MTKAIGLLGGTFDPVHKGHLHMAQQVHALLRLYEVRLIPLNIPPHRDSPIASSTDRLYMLQLAVQDIPGLVIDEREIHREGISWTIDTVRSIRNEQPDASLCLLLGNDAFRQLDNWRDWRKLTDYVHIIVITRLEEKSYSKSIDTFCKEKETTEPDDLVQQVCGCIYHAAVPVLDISSTDIRNRIEEGNDSRDLLPDKVHEYIAAKGLYT